MCCDTACFYVKTLNFENLQFIIKFFWVSDKQQSEADLLRLVCEKEVERVIRLFGHHQITSIVNICERLTFEKVYAFWNITLSSSSSFLQPQSLLSQLFGQSYGLGTAEELSKKWKSVDAEGTLFKRFRSNSQNPDKVKWDKEINSQTTSLYTYNDSLFNNCIFNCLVISPDGHTIHDFWLIPELLKALCNAIKVHKSLYLNGKILYKDILKNNIIITEPKKADGFKGMLIDEDLAKEIGNR